MIFNIGLEKSILHSGKRYLDLSQKIRKKEASLEKWEDCYSIWGILLLNRCGNSLYHPVTYALERFHVFSLPLSQFPSPQAEPVIAVHDHGGS